MPTLAEVAYGLVVVCVVGLVAAAAGAAASLAFQTLAARGERRRFTDLIEPLKAEVGDLWEQLDHFRKRAAKRARDAARETEEEDQLEFDLTTSAGRAAARQAVLERSRGVQ